MDSNLLSTIMCSIFDYNAYFDRLTSAAIKANVLNPPKNPTPTQMINMKPDKTKIDDRSVTKRKCDHPGVVGENESCISTKSNEETSKIIFFVRKIIEL